MDTITISNSGNYNLNINPDSLLFTGFHSQFFHVDSIGSFQIPASSSTNLYISFFAGEEGTKQDSLQIVSNDLSNPKVFIAVSGESRLPQIAFSDTLFNFGDVLIDSVKYFHFEVLNDYVLRILKKIVKNYAKFAKKLKFCKTFKFTLVIYISYYSLPTKQISSNIIIQ